ncbi:MAG: mevalonate kinase [Thermoproteota archaeon]
MGVIASAPAKIILFGEHFVVHGEPALVLAIDKRVHAKAEFRDDARLFFKSVNLNLSGFFEDEKFEIEGVNGGRTVKDARSKLEPLKLIAKKILEIYGEKVGLSIEINSMVPVAAGLGSSAAVATAVTAAISALLNIKLTNQDIFQISYEAEKVVHGTPSGVDPAISTFGGTLLFQADTGFKPIDVPVDLPLIVGCTGVERSTGVQVAKVRALKEKYPQVIRYVLKSGREIVITALSALQKGDLKVLGDLMNINHALLYGLGVSDESLESLITAARKEGALGAKLTGAGGGGCMIALAEDEKINPVLEVLQKRGGTPFLARKTDEGVKIEGK